MKWLHDVCVHNIQKTNYQCNLFMSSASTANFLLKNAKLTQPNIRVSLSLDRNNSKIVSYAVSDCLLSEQAKLLASSAECLPVGIHDLVYESGSNLASGGPTSFTISKHEAVLTSIELLVGLTTRFV